LSIRRLLAATFALLLLPVLALAGDKFVYQREIKVPPFQRVHEVFELPARPAKYDVAMLSDSLGPLTFRVLQLSGSGERELLNKRSLKLSNHQIYTSFYNPGGEYKLVVEIANSNPASIAHVTVIVGEH